jgi:ABC-type molybdate transport system substrate-binding protein
MATVKIGAAPLLANAFGYWDAVNNQWIEGPVITTYKSATSSTDDFMITSNHPSGMLRNQIVNGLTATPPTYPYTLFLSADMQFPEAIAALYGPGGSGQTSDAEVFSQGQLMHWSNGNGSTTDTIDLLSPTIDSTFATASTSIGICDPAMGPYGTAALDALWGTYGIPDTSPKIRTFSPIEAVDAAIGLTAGDPNGVQSGFVPSALHYSGTGVITLPSLDYPDATYRLFPGTDYDLHNQGSLIVYDPTDTPASTAAQSLLTWLATPAGQAALALWGLSF